ncbi:hypothetical protein [Tenggerimyces flavus]|uniref:Gram-positive cocci surface proteins LPxTG domain-containing protein n=1 Tax=Tenggerimyces flavus TaxID=1708749 RepID=A0ABV7YI17_9ACTN|nr:hypothetical protein [Tenggerimyces flavus]MBM7787241.1 hypothetical protein [Tenggerimyces flavus]
MSTKTVLGLAFAAVLASVTFATPAMAVPDEPTELRDYAPTNERCLRPGDALYDHPEVVVEPCRPEAKPTPVVTPPKTPQKAAAVEQDWTKVQVAGGALAGITLLGAGFVGLRRRNRAEN